MEDEVFEGSLLTTSQVAEIFGVAPVTVISWVRQERLKSTMPMKARRIGRRFTVREVRALAVSMDDEEYSLRRLQDWLRANKGIVVAQQGGRLTRPNTVTMLQA